MKKIYSFFTILMMSLALSAQVDTFSVTIQVDLSNETVSPNGVHVAGNFQAAAGFPADWQPNTTALADQGNGIYAVTVDLPVGSYEYKFVNDNDWPGAESVPAAAQVGGGNDNRVLIVTRDTTLLPIVFGAAAPANHFLLRLRADLREQLEIGNKVDTIDGFGVIDVMGSFPLINWNNPVDLLDHDGDSIFDGFTYVPDSTATYEFKLRRERDWNGSEESVSGDCANGTNREITVGNDTTVGPFCYNKCAPCVAVVIDTFEVTFQVDMRREFIIEGPGAMVSVAGNFQADAGFAGDWSPGLTELTDPDGDSIFTTTITIITANATGGVYTFAYKFLNGDSWGTDEGVPAACNVGGNRQGVISGDTVFPVVCFRFCESTCPPVLDPIEVTFRVDLEEAIPAGSGVHLTGNFQNPAWTKDVDQMTPIGDNVYEFKRSMRPGEYQYKFVNGNTDQEEEDGDFIAGGCGVDNGIGGSNRLLDISGLEVDTVLPIFIYNSCDISDKVISVAELGNAAAAYKVYPNPMSDFTYFEILNPNGIYQLSIFDITGKMVYNNENIVNPITKIDKNDLNRGMYIMQIRQDGAVKATAKLMVK